VKVQKGGKLEAMSTFGGGQSYTREPLAS